MRKYMFRGKNEDGKWVYGDLIIEKHGTFICDDLETGWMDDKVDPSSIGMFSGLYDKEGNPIFEGDILRWTDDDGEDCFFRVAFLHGAFLTVSKGQKEEKANELLYDNLSLQGEVVGNIYDDPELMG